MSGWTAAALVGQTSGLPLNTPAGANSYLSDKSFLPGAYTLGDLLEDNGYQNEILLGSDANLEEESIISIFMEIIRLSIIIRLLRMVGLIRIIMFGGVMKI